MKVIGTGHPAPGDTAYLGTAVVPTFFLPLDVVEGRSNEVESSAGLVWHVFGRTP